MTLGELKARIDAIEESYEFFLAYAAQGLTTDLASQAGTQVRDYLKKCYEALEGLTGGFREHLPGDGAAEAMIAVLKRDVEASQAVVGMVMAQGAVSSQLVDNLNASIHVRALLTDLFLLDDLLPDQPAN
ncbi:MAG: hypothetical protein ACR2QM_02860 [Longimicrobiales bacterium]